MHERDANAIDDCWNRIGVQGDRSCPRLETYVHCRQCPVHAAAAKTLLYRLVPGDEAAGGTPLDDSASVKAAPSGSVASLLIFRLHAEWLALPVAALAEVTPMRPIHSLPRRAGIVLGVCNVRGRLIPCISLATLLDLAPRQDAENDAKAAPRMLVMSAHTGTIVVPVDEVTGIHSFAAAAVGPLPDTLAGARYASGVVRHGDRAVGLLDSTRIARAIEEALSVHARPPEGDAALPWGGVAQRQEGRL